MKDLTLEKLNERTKKKGEKKVDKDWTPQRPANNYPIPSFCVPTSNAKNSEYIVRNILSHTLYFIKCMQRERFSDGQTVIAIPRENKKNIQNWGSANGVKNAVKQLIDMGLIAVYCDDYSYKYHRCKLYVYFVDVEREIIEYCKRFHIEKFEPNEKKTRKVRKPKQPHGAFSFKDEEVLIRPDLNFQIPEGMSQREFRQEVSEKLYKNYPTLKFHQEKVLEINRRFYKDYPDFELSFEPSFHWSKDDKVLKGIGIRVSNPLCNKKKQSRAWKKKQYGFTLEKDIKSSVPRFTLSINSGHWIDESVDIYELINNIFEPGKKFTKRRREAIKQFHMNCYFRSGRSDKELTKKMWMDMDKEGLNKVQVDDLMGRLREAIRIAEGGKLWDSEIFYVESCVVIMTLYDLLNAGILTWIVYDCFYSVGFEDEEFYLDMIKNQLKYNFEMFIKREARFKK